MTIAFSRNSLPNCDMDKERMGYIETRERNGQIFREYSHHRHEHGSPNSCFLDLCGRVNLTCSKKSGSRTCYIAPLLSFDDLSKSLNKSKTCSLENQRTLISTLNAAMVSKMLDVEISIQNRELLVGHFNKMLGK